MEIQVNLQLQQKLQTQVQLIVKLLCEVMKKQTDSHKKIQQVQHSHNVDQQIKSFFNVDTNQLNEYFDKQININAKKGIEAEHSALVACNYVVDLNQRVGDQISGGFTHVSDAQKDINDLLVHEKITKEEQKANELRIKREMIQNQIKMLNMQIGHGNNHLGSEGSRVHHQSSQSIEGEHALNVDLHLLAPNLLSKDEHHKMIQKFAKERRQAMIKRRRYQSQLQRKIKEGEQSEKKKQEEQVQRQKEERRRKIEQKMREHEQQSKKRLSEQEINRRKLQEIKHKKFLYQEIQERYNSHVVIPNLQEKKKKLKQLRQFQHAFDIDAIRSHQREYLKKRQASLQNYSKAQQTWNYRPPEKSQRLAKMLEDQKMETRRKLEEKKRALDQRIKKQETYVSHLHQKFAPKISQKKKQQMESRMKKLQKKPQRQGDQHVLGIGYLQQAKKMGRKINETDRPRTNSKLNGQNSESEDSRMIKKRSNTNYLVSGKRQQQYEQIRRRRLDRIVREQGDAHQKIKVLQMEADRVTQQAKRKEYLSKHAKSQEIQQQAIDLLLTSIKAKMGIIDIYKNSS